MTKRMSTLLLAMVLLAFGLFGGCTSQRAEEKSLLKDSLQSFTLALSDDELCGMTLLIYAKGLVFYPHPLTAEQLIESVKENHPEKEIVIDTSELIIHRDIIQQLGNTDYVLSEEKYNQDIGTCFVFVTENNEKVLEIAVGGWGEITSIEDNPKSIYVNGFEVEYNDIVYELVETFLSNKTS